MEKLTILLKQNTEKKVFYFNTEKITTLLNYGENKSF